MLYRTPMTQTTARPARNDLLSETLIGKELHVLIANRDAATINEVAAHYQFETAEDSDGTVELRAVYRGVEATVRCAMVDFTMHIEDFDRKFLEPMADKLVPRHVALVKQMDAMWFRDIRPQLVNFAKQFHEDA